MRLKLKHVDEPSQAHRLQLPGREGAPPTLRDLSAAAAAALGARLPSGTEPLSLRLSLNKQVPGAGPQIRLTVCWVHVCIRVLGMPCVCNHARNNRTFQCFIAAHRIPTPTMPCSPP
jgi:hypothetical protein